MTVTNTNQKNIYVGDDSTLIFAYTFRIFADANISVTISDTSVSPQVDTLLTLNSDYTVSNAGNPAGGNVTLIVGGGSILTAPPTTTDNITLLRETPLTQNLDLITNDNFPSQSQEDAFDKLTFIVQDLQEQFSRSVNIPANITGVDVSLPEPVADQFIGWNSTADALINLPDPSIAAAASAAAAAASAAAALVSENNASTSETNASTSESNASTSASNASTSETNADLARQYAEEWANKAEDSLVSAAAGGDLVDDYSALHWANKAAASAASVNLPTIQAGDAGKILEVNVGETGYDLVVPGTGTLVDDFTIVNNGGVISTAPMILDNIMLNAMNISTNGSITAGTMVDGFVDTYTDQTGIDLGSSADQVFEGGSYRTPIPTVANAETLNMNFACSDGSKEICDSSGQGHIITQNGNATLSPNHYKFGNGALCLNGVNQHLTLADSDDWFLSNLANFNIDTWVKFNSLTVGDQTIVAQQTDANNKMLFRLLNGGQLNFYFRIATVFEVLVSTPTNTIVDNDWHHVEVCKVGTSYAIHVDGYQVAYDTATVTPTNFTGLLYIGEDSTGTGKPLNGYIDDFRITNNNAFSAAPIPQPFLHLTLDENAATTTVTDFGSGGNNGTTVSGNTEDFHADGKVRYGFNLDGVADYVTANGAVASILGDTTGTISMWVNPDDISTGPIVWGIAQGATVNARVFLQILNSGALRLQVRNANTVIAQLVSTASDVSANVWTHIAAVQDGVLLKFYINGVEQNANLTLGAGTEWFASASSHVLDSLAIGCVIAGGAPTNPFNGRLDDVRYYDSVVLTQTQIESIRVAGVAGYYGLGSPNITVPTAAHTDNANTLLLLPFDNSTIGNDLLDISANGGGRFATSINGAGVTGHFGSAYLSLDGVAGTSISTESTLDAGLFASASSIHNVSFWVRLADTAGLINFVNKQQPSGTTPIWQLAQDDGTGAVGFNVMQFQWNPDGVNFINVQALGQAILDNDWHHILIATIGDSSSTVDVAVYLDGTQLSFGASGFFANDSKEIHFGKDISGREVTGDYDDIHINNANLFSATPVAQPFIQLTMNDNAATTNVINTGTSGNDGTATANTDTLTAAGHINTALTFDGAASGTRVNLDSDISTIEGDSVGAWCNRYVDKSYYTRK
jgi:hypothetical protein